MNSSPSTLRRRALLRNGAALAAAIALPPLAAAQAQPALKIATFTLEPFCMLDQQGNASGLVVELQRQLAQESGVALDSVVVPYPRAMAMVVAGDVDLVCSFSNPQLRRHARELGAISGGEVVLVARAGTQFASVAELRGKTVGYIRGAEYDQALQADPAIGRYETISYEQTIRMLLTGRFDAALGVRLSLHHALRRMGLGRELLGPELLLSRRDMLLHYADKTYNPILAAQLRRALDALRARGVLAAALQSYEQALR